jgi:hypothetical protein
MADHDTCAKPWRSSSLQTALPVRQEEMFREVLTALNTCHIPYAICGAFALQRHTGIWRETKDLDVALPQESLSHALHCLEMQGYRCEVTDPVWLAKARRGDFFVDLITGMSNAVIRVDESWMKRAPSAVVVGVSTRVLAAEELLASKIFVTRRERFDGGDIAHLVFASRGAIDWDRVLKLAGDHWQMLLWELMLFAYVYPAHTHFVPRRIWHTLLERFRTAVEHPDAQAKFRGSLVDEYVFAIDVAEWGLEDLLTPLRKNLLSGVGVKAGTRMQD